MIDFNRLSLIKHSHISNMTSDKNKGITSITYNDINQPQKITFSDGKTTENLNAIFTAQGLPQGERLVKLNQIAILQMKVLEYYNGRKLLQ